MLTAYAAAPAVDWLVSRRLRRPLAATLALLPIAVVALLALVLLVPALIHQMQLLIEKLPKLYAYGADLLVGWERRLNPGPAALSPGTLPAPSAAADSAAAVSGVARAPSVAGQLLAQAESLVRAALGGLVGLGKGLGRALQWLGLLLLTPVVAYHLLVDWDRLRDSTLRWLPDRWLPWIRRLTDELQASLRTYLRGQLLVAGLEAVLFSATFAIAGLPQPIALGFLAGLFSLIPILGFWLTVLLVVLNAVAGPSPWPALLKSAAGMLVINVLEGQVLVPKIQGKGLGLHPLVVLLGVLLFGTLFGFAGVLLAVPLLGVVRAILPELLAAWRSSDAFRGGERDQAGLPD
jgi:predicted PurR-regulated permease PerM